MDYSAPQFVVGDIVHYVGDPQEVAEPIVGLSWSPEAGWIYSINSVAFDAQRGVVINGVKTCQEQEIAKVSQEDVTPTPEEVTPENV
jgi:hypothetical protein